MLDDLNDLFYFAKVVEHAGFAAAGRALRQPKSKLSRRVGQLEDRLGIRLIERSARRFRVTDVGAAFYARCQTILDEVEQAQALASEARSEPHGIVRCSCPTGLVEVIIAVIPELLLRYPGMRLQLIATDRRVSLIDERVDVAIRVRVSLDSDAELTVRPLQRNRRILVAAPAVARALGDVAELEALAHLPTLSSTDDASDVVWELVSQTGERRAVHHAPRLACADFAALRSAAIAGLGVALLPDHACAAAVEAGQLVRVFPAWGGAEGIVHLVFTTRRGLPPAVRALIDHLAARLADR